MDPKIGLFFDPGVLYRFPYGICVFNPSLETRSGEHILCFDEFMLEVVKTQYASWGDPMEAVVSTPLWRPEVVKNIQCFDELMLEVVKHSVFRRGSLWNR